LLLDIIEINIITKELSQNFKIEKIRI